MAHALCYHISMYAYSASLTVKQFRGCLLSDGMFVACCETTGRRAQITANTTIRRYRNIAVTIDERYAATVFRSIFRMLPTTAARVQQTFRYIIDQCAIKAAINRSDRLNDRRPSSTFQNTVTESARSSVAWSSLFGID